MESQPQNPIFRINPEKFHPCVFVLLKINFIIANSGDPDKMLPYYAAFHLGLHCLQKYLFRGIKNRKGSTLP